MMEERIWHGECLNNDGIGEGGLDTERHLTIPHQRGKRQEVDIDSRYNLKCDVNIIPAVRLHWPGSNFQFPSFMIISTLASQGARDLYSACPLCAGHMSCPPIWKAWLTPPSYITCAAVQYNQEYGTSAHNMWQQRKMPTVFWAIFWSFGAESGQTSVDHQVHCWVINRTNTSQDQCNHRYEKF